MRLIPQSVKRKCLNENGNVAAVMGVILLIIVSLIGIVVLSNVQKVTEPMVNLSSGTTTGTSKIVGEGYGWNTTFTTLLSTETSGANLLFVMIIVVPAALILGILMYSFMNRRKED